MENVCKNKCLADGGCDGVLFGTGCPCKHCHPDQCLHGNCGRVDADGNDLTHPECQGPKVETTDQWIARIEQATKEGLGKALSDWGVDETTSRNAIREYLEMFLVPVLKVREDMHASLHMQMDRAAARAAEKEAAEAGRREQAKADIQFLRRKMADIEDPACLLGLAVAVSTLRSSTKPE